MGAFTPKHAPIKIDENKYSLRDTDRRLRWQKSKSEEEGALAQDDSSLAKAGLPSRLLRRSGAFFPAKVKAGWYLIPSCRQSDLKSLNTTVKFC